MRTLSFLIVVLIGSHVNSQNEKIYDISEVDDPPVLENYLTNEELTRKKDFEKSILAFVYKNISIITSKQTSVEKAYVEILIDEKGQYTIINSRASNKKAEKAALKTIKKLPGFSSPATVNGKPVKMRFIIPVSFSIYILN